MRKVLTLTLTVALATSLAAPLTLLAQNSTAAAAKSADALAGRSVDAMGRGVASERVELVRGSQVLASTTTNAAGEWSFNGVEAGDYTIRMNVRGRIAGVRVTVVAGKTAASPMIVVPAATAALQIGTLANLLALVPAASATAVQTVAATVNVTETTELSPEIVMAILESLPVGARQDFAEAVVAAIEALGTGQGGTFTQYVEEFTQIANEPQALPDFPPPSVDS